MVRTLLILTLAMLLPAGVSAHEFRLEQIPNGGKLDCTLCHIASAGGGPRNVFGTQVEENGLDGEGAIETQDVVWTQIYDMDADGDGFTNGFELGDPDGMWEFGTEPDFGPSLPQDPESVPCGSGNLHPDEECDGDEFADDATCMSLGFTDGTLACNTDCTLDTSQCVGEPDMGMATDMGASSDAGTSTDAGTTAGDDVGVADDAGGGTDEEEQGGGYGPYYDNPPPRSESSGPCSGDLEVADTGVEVGLLLLLPLGWRRRRPVS